MTRSAGGRSRPSSAPNSIVERRSSLGRRFSNTVDDMWLPSPAIVVNTPFEFNRCSQDLCGHTSQFSLYDSMTLRLGFDKCVSHITQDDIVNKMMNEFIPENAIYIFYDVEITAAKEIEQLGAVSSTGEHFSTIIKTSTRKNSSPILRKIPPMPYMRIAIEPRSALQQFKMWVKGIVNKYESNSVTDESIVMVAHYGSCHDHVLLLRTMMNWKLTVPSWRFSDTLPIFKVVVNPREPAKLTDLVFTYVPWFTHTPHDALSDAQALAESTKSGVKNWSVACYVFSSTRDDFIKSVGLNMFGNVITSPVQSMVETEP